MLPAMYGAIRALELNPPMAADPEQTANGFAPAELSAACMSAQDSTPQGPSPAHVVPNRLHTVSQESP